MNEVKLAPAPGSAIQERALRWLCRNQCEVQIAGHGRAAWLSAANALMRRGLARSYRTGRFYATDAGRAWVAANPPNTELRNAHNENGKTL